MEEKKVLERLQRQCSKAEYCSSDVRRKALKAMEGDSEAASRIVEALVRERFVDDGRYAAAFSREKSSLQGWGAIKIRFMLRSKGISDEIVSAALEEIDSGKAERKLDKLVSDKARLLEGDPQKRLKLLKYALGRGYSYDEVEKAIDRLAQPRG